MKKIFFAALIFLAQYSFSQDSSHPHENSLKMLPVLWQQHAAEYKALCYQAFNIASLRLKENIKKKTSKEKLAIITDLDETILDNSYSEAKLIKEGKEYSSASWREWTSLSAATAVPGAVEFLRSAKQKGVTIFYVSNRGTNEVLSTLLNLQKLHLPDADTSHMLFLDSKAGSSSKETRRQLIMKKYKVIMLLGDNLNDFTQFFEHGTIAARKEETDKVKEEWGKKFIVLPNSTYGEWENSFYNYQRLKPQQKYELLLQLLKGY